MQEHSMYKAMKELRELKALREEDDKTPSEEEESIGRNEPNLNGTDEEIAKSAEGAESAESEEDQIVQNEPIPPEKSTPPSLELAGLRLESQAEPLLQFPPRRTNPIP